MIPSVVGIMRDGSFLKTLCTRDENGYLGTCSIPGLIPTRASIALTVTTTSFAAI